MLVMLAVFVLGYAVCLAMPVASANPDELKVHRLEVDVIVAGDPENFLVIQANKVAVISDLDVMGSLCTIGDQACAESTPEMAIPSLAE